MAKHPLYNETGLLKNNKPHVLYALVNKRAELDGLRIELKNKLLQLECEIEAIDNSIKIFDPELSVSIKPKKPKFDNVNRKSIRKVILDVMRTHKVPLNRSMIYEKVADNLGVDLEHGAVRQKLKNIASQILIDLCKKEVLERKDFGNKHNAVFSLKLPN